MDFKEEELRNTIIRLERRIEELETKNRRLDTELYSAEFKIRQELEPRIASEKRCYDSYITNNE